MLLNGNMMVDAEEQAATGRVVDMEDDVPKKFTCTRIS